MLRLVEQFTNRTALVGSVQIDRRLAQAIVDTVREPLLVLDQELCVVAASRSFYETFQVSRQETHGRPLYELGDGQWDIPALRNLLEKIVPEHGVLEAYEVDREFPALGQRNMLMNARLVRSEAGADKMLLLAIEDVTERRAGERKMRHLLREKELLLEEVEHRIANSLQIIASILSMKSGTAQTEETRLHLQDACKRVMSVAAIQQHLRPSVSGEKIAIAPYLTALCQTLGQSMVRDGRSVELSAAVGSGTLASSEAVSIGLIVTECVINALKHAFPEDGGDNRILVAYERHGTDWMLSIADNGHGKLSIAAKPGLGTRIVNALALQLGARVEIASGLSGTTVSVIHTERSARSTLHAQSNVEPSLIQDLG